MNDLPSEDRMLFERCLEQHAELRRKISRVLSEYNSDIPPSGRFSFSYGGASERLHVSLDSLLSAHATDCLVNGQFQLLAGTPPGYHLAECSRFKFGWFLWRNRYTSTQSLSGIYVEGFGFVDAYE